MKLRINEHKLLEEAPELYSDENPGFAETLKKRLISFCLSVLICKMEITLDYCDNSMTDSQTL